MIAAGDIAIKRLRVRASTRDVQSVSSDLIHGSWSVDDHEQWLFIRNIVVSSRKTDLRRHASDALNVAIAQAVDGRLSGAASANAVRFRSCPEMLAYLLRDLADGSAVHRWYWQRWRYLISEPSGLAVARVLWENVQYLGALVEQLIAIRQLANIWQELTHASAHQIIRQYQAVSPVSAAVAPITITDGPTAAASVWTARLLASRPALLYEWVTPLAALDPTDHRFRLAALITGRQLMPLHVARDQTLFIEAFAGALHCIDNRARQSIGAKAGTRTVPLRQSGPETRRRWPAVERQHTGDTSARFKQRQPSEAPFPAVAVSELQNVDGSNTAWQPYEETSRGRLSAQTRSIGDRIAQSTEAGFAVKNRLDEAEAPVLQTSRLYDPGASAISGDTFITRSAGLFYLINGIRDDTCQALLAGRIDRSYHSGWLWLFDLARCIGAEPDASLLAFIAHQCGLSAVEELLSMAPLPETAQIEVILSTRYANQDWWNASLVDTPGCVVYTASHVDVFYALQSVRLPVRQAGLDLNPGWVPWLGRVVTFHYRESGSLPFSTDIGAGT